MNYFLHNHQIVEQSALQGFLLNRSFYYGDGFFETILYRNGKFPLLKFHVERIKSSCEILNFEIPYDFIFEKFENELHQLIIANKIENINAVVKINFFRNGESGYLSKLNTFSYLAEIKKWQPKNENLSLCFYENEKKATGKLANLKSANALIYVMAAQFAKNKIADEAIVLNTENNIADCTNYNLFFIKNETIFTPPITDGGVDGIGRKLVMQHFAVQEKSVAKNELLQADEIFVTNAVRLIHPVIQVNDVEFNIKKSVAMKEELLHKLYHHG